MSITYRISDDGKTVFTNVEGRISMDDFIAYQIALATEVRFDPEGCELIDATNAEPDMTINYSNVACIEDSSPWHAASRRAVVASGMLAYGIANIFVTVMRRSHGSFQMFRSLEPALGWLGIEADRPGSGTAADR